MNDSRNNFMTGEPVILPLPSSKEVTKMVDELITPEYADREAHILIDLLTSVADFETPEKARLADAAIKAAYRKTSHFDACLDNGLANFMRGQFNHAPGTNEKSDQTDLIG